MILKHFEKYARSQWTAEDWYIRNQSPKLSEADCIAFLAWLEESNLNEVDYARVETVSSLMSQTAIGTTHLSPERHSPDPRKRDFGPRIAIAVTAAAALVLILVPFLEADKDYHTQIGEQRLVVLDDGSSVRLNTATSVKVDYGKTQRVISLDGGEAFFNVQKDPESRPFLVEIDGVIVRAVGTEFNIRQNEDSLTVSVLEGVVEVLKLTNFSTKPSVMSRLTEGYKFNVGSMGVSKPEKISDRRDETAWTEGWVTFNSATLKAAVKELNRYSEVKLVIADPNIETLIVGGSFKIGYSEQFARNLAEVHPISVDHKKGVLILSSEP